MIFTIIICGLLVVEGIFSLITGKSLGESKKSIEKYDPKAYATYSRVSGVFIIIAAIGIVIVRNDTLNLNLNIPSFIGWIVTGVGLAGIIIFYFAILKNKKPGSSSDQSDHNSSSGSSNNEEYIDED